MAGIFTLFGITILSEAVDDRSLISMVEDLWSLPFLVALYTLPAKPNQWVYYGLASGLLRYDIGRERELADQLPATRTRTRYSESCFPHICG